MLVCNRFQDRSTALCVLLCLNIIGLLYYSGFFFENNYLPSPFVSDKSNTFMDFFNPLYWAEDDGRYTLWGSVYPPLNFLFLRLLSYLSQIQLNVEPNLIREDGSLIIFTYIALYFTLPLIIIKSKLFLFFSDLERVLIYAICVTCTPMLFTLERGNLVLIAIPFLMTTIKTRGLYRVLSIALLINIKPYFAVLSLFFLVRGNFSDFIKCILISLSIFVLSGFILGGEFIDFFSNILGFFQNDNFVSIREILALPSSISSFSSAFQYLKSNDVISTDIPNLSFHFEFFKWALLASAVYVLFTRTDSLRDWEIFFILILIILNLGTWVGGYTMILYLCFIPYMFKAIDYKLYLICIAIIASPIDLISLYRYSAETTFSFLANQYVEMEWTLGAGVFVRPTINFFLLLLLCRKFYFKL